MDGLWARGENETPNPKHQAPEKSQASNSKTCRRLAALELGSWSFFGVWCLVFGALIGTLLRLSKRRRHHLVGGALARQHCNERAAPHDSDAVAHAENFGQVAGDHQHRQTSLRE